MQQDGLFDNAASQASGLIPEVKESMWLCAKESNLSREQILDRMNAISLAAGVKLTAGNTKSLSLATLEKWLNPADRDHLPGILALNIYCVAVQDVRPLGTQLKLHGCEVMTPRDQHERDYGRVCLAVKNARKQKRQLEAALL